MLEERHFKLREETAGAQRLDAGLEGQDAVTSLFGIADASQRNKWRAWPRKPAIEVAIGWPPHEQQWCSRPFKSSSSYVRRALRELLFS